MTSIGFAAPAAGAKFERFSFERRALGPTDLRVEIDYAGICHSDIHQARGEWGRARFPMVPGHEIVGRVIEKGSQVEKFHIGEAVGIGVYIDSCRTCPPCLAGNSHFCDRGMIETYNSMERDGVTPTYGGYSSDYVIDANYAIAIPDDFLQPEVAPLLCAGITLYSPLRHWNAFSGKDVAIMGLGGLGHIGVKFAAAMGAKVTVLSHSPTKEADAFRLGADRFIVVDNDVKLRREFDLILNTVSAELEIEEYLQMLRIDGTLVAIGLPGKPYSVRAGTLLDGRRSLAGSMIGSIAQTQEMIDFAHVHSITSEIELIDPAYIDTAFERTVQSDVRYRFVIDIKKWRASLQR